MADHKGLIIESTIGKVKPDIDGSPVAVVRMDATKAYTGIPILLKQHIDSGNPQAWEQVKARIDYIYINMDYALGNLDKETAFGDRIKTQLKNGQKLFFKPNLVSPTGINPITHGAGDSHSAITEWPLVAALMRWFHDKLGVSYNEMAIGEAATAMTQTAMIYGAEFNGNKPVTTESIIEGKRGNFYGGWGFYFVRRYLSDNHPKSHKDDPMNGYEESVSGTYLTPGRTGNRLMVYDLNRVSGGKGREIPVPNGINFKVITMHKVLVGGNPTDQDDMKNYPGCVLVNVPRMKTHNQEFLTCAIKNIGIGLYPMEATYDSGPNSTNWKYSVPNSYPPSQKALLPHQTWTAEIDTNTGLPLKDEKGKYRIKKTGGLVGTIADAIAAVSNQNTFMVHVVDAIEPLSVSWGPDSRVPEGLVLASLDPVALDLLCYRYAFNMTPIREARLIQKEKNLATDFIQKVPMPVVNGINIVTDKGYDTPILRTHLFDYAESRGLGQQRYHVVGWDAVTGNPLVSLEGHLGRVENGKFVEVLTTTLYYFSGFQLWNLQATSLNYLKANDHLTGSSYLKEVLEALDEDGDGAIGVHDVGKKGAYQAVNRWLGDGSFFPVVEKYGRLHAPFLMSVRVLRNSQTEWNTQGYDFSEPFRLSSVIAMAMGMSKSPTEQKDPFFHSMTWGKGKWPSVQYVNSISTFNAIYGASPVGNISTTSIYGYAFQYADKILNNGVYTGGLGITNDPESVNRYLKAVSEGATPLDFVVYVPKGFGINGRTTPNLEETTDPAKVFTVSFNHGTEVW